MSVPQVPLVLGVCALGRNVWEKVPQGSALTNFPTPQITRNRHNDRFSNHSADGKKFKVSGPDQAGAVAALKKYIAASNQPAPSAPASTNGAAGAIFDRITKALRNAHQAGDTNAATRLAAMAKTARAKEAATGSENLKKPEIADRLESAGKWHPPSKS